jgi:hypothetical protein
VIKFVSDGAVVSPGPPVSSTNKTDCHDIAELLLKVALNIIMGTDFIGSCKSNYHAITAMTAPLSTVKQK